MTARIVVVTGTDTGVGKTWVTAALASAAREQGTVVRAIKPVESGVFGAEPSSDEDGVLLANAAGQDWPRAALTRLRAPLAPPIAAENEGRTLDFNGWVDTLRKAAETCDLLLVEGAGGLCSPLTWTQDVRDLATLLQSRVLVVAHNKLGVVHQVRAVTQCLAVASLPLLGVVLNRTQSNEASTRTNPSVLARYLADVPAVVTYEGQPADEQRVAIRPLLRQALQ